MSRTPAEVLEHHVAALTAGDVDGVVEDYTEDAVVLTPEGEYRGRDGVRQFFTGLAEALPNPALEAGLAAFAGDLLLLHWTASSSRHTVPDGVDTFVFADGAIRFQTVTATLVPVT